jgi:SAM-dependent methyltransferase
MHPWESEYRNPQFITLGTEPLSDIRDFMKWIKKWVRKNPADFSAPITDWAVFDAGCGNGKNLNYIVENFCEAGIGYDISETAISLAKKLAGDIPIRYEVRSIGNDFDIPDTSIDLVIDATSSHVLSTSERGKFLKEISRVIKPSGFYFLRTLAIEGDTNAKNLIKQFPGNEPNTYVLPGTGMTERVFSKSDIERDFGNDFKILHIEKTTGYQKWGNQSYKRNYWVVYLQKVNKQEIKST